jgi:hypothetical protein
MKKGEKVISIKYLKSIEANRIEKIKFLLKELKKNAISKEHRHDVISLDCPECKFRLVEAGLAWWLDLEEWSKKT